MGHIAELMLDGTLCEECGAYIDCDHADMVEWPRICPDCAVAARQRGDSLQYDGFGGYHRVTKERP